MYNSETNSPTPDGSQTCQIRTERAVPPKKWWRSLEKPVDLQEPSWGWTRSPSWTPGQNHRLLKMLFIDDSKKKVQRQTWVWREWAELGRGKSRRPGFNAVGAPERWIITPPHPLVKWGSRHPRKDAVRVSRGCCKGPHTMQMRVEPRQTFVRSLANYHHLSF